ncbi:hypothetical protein [Streptomyces sp. NPDC047453]|uniref:hypothetical protein n=1 Tax=Streptomyces sp. NPDC047453 TaxID=3154812 RepID=UPI0033D6C43E
MFITDTVLRRIHHPYDGGADVVLAGSPVTRLDFEQWRLLLPFGCGPVWALRGCLSGDTE